MKTIEIDSVSFRYRKNSDLVLNNISLSCEQGSINVLIGLNGSGKTTLIKLIIGLLDKYEGKIYINETPLNEMTVKERAKAMAYVPQRSNYADDYTVKDYLLFGKVNSMRFYQAPSNTEIEDTLKQAARFNITKLLDKKLGELSGGERQIVSICCAMIQGADIIILDEPTSALDIKNQAMILNLIKSIAINENKTFILSSHNPNQALYLDSHVFLLKDGTIIKDGNAKEIITTDNLFEIYGNEIKYSKDLEYNEVTF